MKWILRPCLLSGFYFLSFFFFSARASALSPGEEAYQKGDYEKAEQYFEEQKSKHPEDTGALYNLGSSLYQQKRYEEATEQFEKVVEQKPDFEYGWYNLGVSLAGEQRYQDAIDAFEKALQLNPQDDAAKRNIEILRKKIKKKPKSDKSKAPPKNKKKDDQKGGNKKNDSPEKTGSEPDQKKGRKKGSDGKKGSDSNPGQSGTPTPSPDGAGKSQEPAKQKGADEDRAFQKKAQKELGMSEDRIKQLMANAKKQEEQTQEYYSPDPRREGQKQRDELNYLPSEMRQFMRHFLGQTSKGDDKVEEDW